MDLYEKYRDRVQFVVIDLNRTQSLAQQELVKKFYRGYIPHVTILDSSGKTVYNASGEVNESKIAAILDKLLKGE